MVCDIEEYMLSIVRRLAPDSRNHRVVAMRMVNIQMKGLIHAEMPDGQLLVVKLAIDQMA